ASHRVSTVEIAALSHGVESTTPVTGAMIASASGLRSTWFRVGLLSLLSPSPNPPVAPGTRVRLTGVVRGVRGVFLQERSLGGAWTQLKAIVPAALTGAFHLTVRPHVTTWYRLATARDATAYVRIRVAA